MFSIFLRSCEWLSARLKGTQSGVMFGMVGEGVGGWRGESGGCSGRGMVIVDADPALPCWHKSEL